MTKSPYSGRPASPSSAGPVRQTNALAGAMKTVGTHPFGIEPAGRASEVVRASSGVNALSSVTAPEASRVRDIASGLDALRMTTPFSSSGAVTDLAANALRPSMTASETSGSVTALASGVNPFGIVAPLATGGGFFEGRADALRPSEISMLSALPENALQSPTVSMSAATTAAANALSAPTISMLSATALNAHDASGRAFGQGAGTLLPPPSYSPPTSAPPSPPRTRKRIGKVADLGVLVRDRRQALGLTQQELADAAGTGRRFISELEGGKPTLEFGKVLTVCLCVGVDLSAVTR